MRFTACLFAFWSLSSVALGQTQVDLTRIDRTILKEPAYRAKPRYGLLILGPKAETRVWMVIDDKTLYVDRNRDGDLTDEGERVAAETKNSSDLLEFHAGDLVEADGKRKHSRLVVYQYSARQLGHLVNGVDVADVMTFPGMCNNPDEGCSFANSPKDAPIIHLGGPLTMRVHSAWVADRAGKSLKLFSEQLGGLIDFPRFDAKGQLEAPFGKTLYKLKAGEHVGELHVQVGTPGLGRGTFASLAVEKGFPPNLHPTVEISAASKRDPTKTVKAVFELKERC